MLKSVLLIISSIFITITTCVCVCVYAAPVKAKYVIREETNYTYSSSSLIQPIAWNNNCSSLYDSQFKFAMTNVSTSLSAICSQAANTFVNVSIDLDSIMLFNDDPTLVCLLYLR
jgi:hypothetical protein